MPPNGAVKTNRNRGAAMLVVAAAVTLFTMLILAAISPKAMVIGAGIVFVFLLARFVWLIRRELQ